MRLWVHRGSEVVLEDAGVSCCVGGVVSVFSGVGAVECGVWLEDAGMKGHSCRLVVRGGGWEWTVCLFGYRGERVSKGDIVDALVRRGFGDAVRFCEWYVGGSDYVR